MQRALIDWRPLGQLFVDAGLISADELEETLAEQSATGERLGEILVAHGLASAPDLTRALVDQLGRELEGERPNGLVSRRAPAASEQPSDGAPLRRSDPDPSPQSAPASQLAQATPPRSEPVPSPPAPVAPVLASTVQPAPALVPSPSASSGVDDDEPHLLLVQLDAMRERLTREFAARESALAEKLTALQTSLERVEASVAAERASHREGMATLEKSLEAERTAHRRTVDELERGRSEARRQAAELSECVGRIRSELAQIDAGGAWFQYWGSNTEPQSALPDALPAQP